MAWLLANMLADPQAVAYYFGFVPARWSGVATPFDAVPSWLSPLTSAFVHSGLMHIAFNLILFLWCGLAVERVLGAANLCFIYLVGAYAAAAAQYAVDPMSVVPMVGASGAISAVVGAFALSFGRPKRVTRSPALNRALNGLWLLVAWVFLQIAVGWIAGQEGYALATPAHIGGFVAGLLMQRPLLVWRYRQA